MIAIVIVGTATAALPLWRGRTTAPRRHYLVPAFTYEPARGGGPPRVLSDGLCFNKEFMRLAGLRIRTERVHVVDMEYGLEGDDLPRRVPVPTGEFPVWYAHQADAYGPSPSFALATRRVLLIPFRDETPVRWYADLHGPWLKEGSAPGFPSLHLQSRALAILDETVHPRFREAFSDFKEAFTAAQIISEEHEVLARKRTPDATGHAYWRERGLLFNQPRQSDGVLVYSGQTAKLHWGVNGRDETVCLVILFEN